MTVRCPVCKSQVAAQFPIGNPYAFPVTQPHPRKKGPGLCDGSGRPEKR